MNNQKEVWRFFEKDPVCRIIFRIYEKLKFPLYAVVTFLYLLVSPLVLDYFFYRRLPDFSSLYFLRAFLIYGIIPIMGSYLGYRWLSSVLFSFREFVDKGVLKEADAAVFKDNMIRLCNYKRFIVLALLFVLLAINKIYLRHFVSVFSHRLLTDAYVFLVTVLWWYLIIKVFLVCLAIFYSYKKLLLAKSSSQYILNTSLYHPDTFCGLASIGRLCFNFLLLYVVAIGGYLVLIIWSGSYRLLDPFILGILALYLILPAYGFRGVIWTAHIRMKEAKYEELDKVWQKSRSAPPEEYGKWIPFYEQIKSHPSWPIGVKEGVSLFYAYWMPVAFWFVKLAVWLKENDIPTNW